MDPQPSRARQDVTPMRVRGSQLVQGGRGSRLLRDESSLRELPGVTEPIGMELLRQFNVSK
jgi:hypothetical protein